MSHGDSTAADTTDINRPLLGILLFLLGILCMAVMDAAAKWLAVSYVAIQLVFFNSIFGTIPLAVILSKEGMGSLKTKNWYLLAARGFITVGTMFFFFTALKYLPLAEVTIIFLVAPLLTVLLSCILLGEKVHRVQIACIAVGLAGAVLIVRPGALAFQLTMLLPLGAALCAALGLVASKVLVRSETSSALVAYELLVLFGVSALLVPEYWVTPDVSDLPVMALMGIMGALSVYYRTRACSHTSLGILAPFEYTGMIWAIIFGFMIWAELPDIWGWTGAALIAGSGTILAHQGSATEEAAEA